MIPEGPLRIPRLAGPIRHTWYVPGSKSVTNRALVLAALSEGTTRLEGVLRSDDTGHMRKGLQALGIAIEEPGPTTLLVHGGRSRLKRPEVPIDVGNSGTTVRFLSALTALVDGPITLEGDSAMARRPIADLADALRQLGVRVDCPTGCPPLTVWGGRLPGGTVHLSGERSSQYFSALLMAGVGAEGELRVEVEGTLVSRPYVTMTCRMIEDFGGNVQSTESGFRVAPRAGGYRARSYFIEPDASSASYAFALAAATGSEICVPGLNQGCLQGDYQFLEVLTALGAETQSDPKGSRVRGTGTLRGVTVDMHHISDTVMTLAALAPLCAGPTRIIRIGNIRIKETDRLEATATELSRLGQRVSTGEDWIQIEPAPLSSGRVRCYADHRMAMSFAVLGAAVGDLEIDDPACVAKTYPNFWEDLASCFAAAGQATPW